MNVQESIGYAVVFSIVETDLVENTQQWVEVREYYPDNAEPFYVIDQNKDPNLKNTDLMMSHKYTAIVAARAFYFTGHFAGLDLKEEDTLTAYLRNYANG